VAISTTMSAVAARTLTMRFKLLHLPSLCNDDANKERSCQGYGAKWVQHLTQWTSITIMSFTRGCR
jgi:hypothetical protein